MMMAPPWASTNAPHSRSGCSSVRQNVAATFAPGRPCPRRAITFLETGAVTCRDMGAQSDEPFVQEVPAGFRQDGPARCGRPG